MHLVERRDVQAVTALTGHHISEGHVEFLELGGFPFQCFHIWFCPTPDNSVQSSENVGHGGPVVGRPKEKYSTY